LSLDNNLKYNPNMFYDFNLIVKKISKDQWTRHLTLYYLNGCNCLVIF
jgi:hypothetical protein